jgi:hypothetical protein
LVADYFLSSFNTGLASVGFSRFDPKNLRQFQDAFPILGPDDVENYLDWHDRVVLHGLTFGVFVPPVHTLRDGQPLGTWFPLLPLHVQNDAINHFAFLLTGCIRSKLHSSLRQEYPDIYSTIQGHKADGYLLLYDLALHAGHHPHLRHHGSVSSEPSQHADMTLTSYINAWLQFAQHQLLDGTVYSDRFFHQQFLYRIHPTIRSRIGPYLHQTVLQIPHSSPLPPSLAPDRLRSHLIQHVQHLQIKQLLSKTPRQLSSPSPPSTTVRSLTNTQEHDPYESLLIAAVRVPGPCILCRSSDHKLSQCPSLSNLQHEPFFCQMLLRQLQRIMRSHGSSTSSDPTSRRNAPSSTTSRSQLRQITSSSPAETPLLLPAPETGEGRLASDDLLALPSEPREGLPDVDSPLLDFQ